MTNNHKPVRYEYALTILASYGGAVPEHVAACLSGLRAPELTSLSAAMVVGRSYIPDGCLRAAYDALRESGHAPKLPALLRWVRTRAAAQLAALPAAARATDDERCDR